ncbi:MULTISPECIES: hypothetical protein, partial [Klebsiella pneumoniae complex]|uniref:hypothetical protein n=1 Tax=Klebsiella pneumoniae complex TaxID=3390273 RepID=UPI001951AEB3
FQVAGLKLICLKLHVYIPISVPTLSPLRKPTRNNITTEIKKVTVSYFLLRNMLKSKNSNIRK